MKRAFTLAEVLITLGIIGVVAALTTPALIQNVGNAKIGPKLQKAKATWENACEMMLNEENSNSIFGVARTSEKLGEILSNYMKISKSESYQVYDYNGEDANLLYRSYEGTVLDLRDNINYYLSDDGIMYFIAIQKNKGIPPANKNIPHNQYLGRVFVDINEKQKPNRIGKDIFVFSLFNDGSLEPLGTHRSYAWDHSENSSYVPWRDHGDSCSENYVGSGFQCAGSIFDNGMKIIYE